MGHLARKTNPMKKIVAFLQNTWLKQPESSDKIRHYLIGEDDASIRFRRRLLSQSRTGKNLLNEFGDDFKNVIWCNASPIVTSESSGNPPPDLNHIQRIINHHEPDLILGFGKNAQHGIREVIKRNGNVANRFNTAFFPHPVAYGGSIGVETAASVVRNFLKESSKGRIKYFFDTEFIERGPEFPLIFISIGIVSEYGEEYYAVNNKFMRYVDNPDGKLEFYEDYGKLEWLWDNVITKLEHRHSLYKPIKQIATEIVEFVKDRPIFWGYYSAYDHVILCQLYGTMMDLPEGWPMYTKDIKQLCDSLGNPQLPKEDKDEHNSLSDAHWNLKSYNYLMDYRREI